MGLDTVELVMAVEEEFQIDIPNEVAATLITLGDICARVVEVLRSRGGPVDPQDVWGRVEAIIRRDYAIASVRLTPETAIVADLGLD